MVRYRDPTKQIDDINSITCVVWAPDLRFFYSNHKKLETALAKKAAGILYDRGISAYYSTAIGRGAGEGFFTWQELIMNLKFVFKTLTFAKAIKAAYAFASFYYSQFLKQKIRSNKTSYQILLIVDETKKLGKYDYDNFGKRMMQLNLIAKTIGEKLQSDYPDYVFSYGININLKNYHYHLGTDCFTDEGSLFINKLNKWLLNTSIEKELDIRINKGKFSRLRVLKNSNNSFV